jgi:hypothetical protein
MDFDDFYALYPRKEGKKDGLKAWGQITEEQHQKAIEAIPSHVKRWHALGTEKHYIPLVASWLRGWRFDDEIEIPKPKNIEQAWWTSETLVLAKGRELGCLPRPGEDMTQYKGRLIERLNGRANVG